MTVIFDLLTLNVCSISSVMHKIFTKFERNQIIHDLLDSLVRFRRSILGGIFTERFSRVREPNFTKLDRDVGQSFLHKKFVSDLRYLAAFLNACGLKLSSVLDDANFHIF